MGTETVAGSKKINKKGSGTFDLFFLVLVVLIVLCGLVMLFSASYASGLSDFGDSMYYIKHQLLAALIGVGGMLIVSRLNYWVYKKLALAAAVIAVILLIMIFPMGVTRNGAKRWLNLGILFQPSEIAKIAMVLLLAKLISINYKNKDSFVYGTMRYLFVIGIFAILIVLEPHLSGAILIGIIGFSMMFAGGVNWKHLVACLLVLVLAVVLIISFTSYMQDRINAWVDPWNPDMIQDESYQIVQSLYAIGSGGLMGRGLSNSQQKYGYLPEAHNDYIFAVACEELGFVGALAIIIMFALLVWRGLYIARKAPDKFSCLMCVGIMTQIGAQAFLNIAVVTNAIPSTGISLPFFSYGGTSLCLLLVEMGMVLNVSRYADLGQKKPELFEEGDK